MKDKKNYLKLKQSAVKLRQKGKSYSEISKKINISKSTLSYWLKGIFLKPQFKKFYTPDKLAY